ncbi:hypothetical protein CHUAL_008342 [Chamberlinius hualienensis]
MKLLQNYIILVLSVTANIAKSRNLIAPIVETVQGLVLGSIKISLEGRPFYSFQGIPYGEPPIGPRRFKAPEPAESWDGVLSATSDAPTCLQSEEYESLTSGSEDCLTLSVYTPHLPNNSTNISMTVYAYIHGGSFYFHGVNYNFLNPERYMNIDIVVVTIQYRLGPLGFLATDDEAASGNFGLLDQHLALKWIQENVAAFGGDPNDVTLSGHSAGSASVLYHYLSPMSAGLFHRAIAASGTPLCPIIFQNDALKHAKQMANFFNCSSDNTTEIIECLREVPAVDIILKSIEMMGDGLKFHFVPNVETSSHGRFLTNSPSDLLKSGQFNRVPIMLGFTRDEGVMLYESSHVYFGYRPFYIFNFLIPRILAKTTDYGKRLIPISYAIKKQYYLNVDFSNRIESNRATIKWMSDILMNSHVCQTAALISSHNVTTYLYSYNYVSSSGNTNYTGEPDIAHTNELPYLWHRKNITDPKDQQFGHRFFQIWTNFATKGKPTLPEETQSEWLPTPPGEYNYYDIQDNFTMRGNWETERMTFWWNKVPAIVNCTAN